MNSHAHLQNIPAPDHVPSSTSSVHLELLLAGTYEGCHSIQYLLFAQSTVVSAA